MKIFNAAPVAKAIDHAVNVGAHVISMSLGGIPSFALRQAIRRAVRQNVILVAAAGNCVGLVVWPAAYPEMIAVGGTNIRDNRWKGSSHGPAVDFAAPAEFVWRADRQKPDAPKDGIAGGQGTSFATAPTAAMAAAEAAGGSVQVLPQNADGRGIGMQDFAQAMSPALVMAAARLSCRFETLGTVADPGDPNHLRHRVWTAGSSSGGLCLDNRLRPIALHRAKVTARDAQGRARMLHNLAVRLSAIHAARPDLGDPRLGDPHRRNDRLSRLADGSR